MLAGWQAQGDREMLHRYACKHPSLPFKWVQPKILTVYNVTFLLSAVWESKMNSNNVTACVLIAINIPENSNYWFKQFNTLIFSHIFSFHMLVGGMHIFVSDLWLQLFNYTLLASQSMIVNMNTSENKSHILLENVPCSVVCLTRVSWRLSWRGRNSESLRFERKRRGKKRRRKRRT